MSSNSLPYNFDWRQYIILNKDLHNIKSKKEAIEHYLKHGKKEKRQYVINRFNYKTVLPEDFNWKNYLILNKDLNIRKNKKDVIFHYILHGKNRKYKIHNNTTNDNSVNNLQKKSKNTKNVTNKSDNAKNVIIDNDNINLSKIKEHDNIKYGNINIENINNNNNNNISVDILNNELYRKKNKKKYEINDSIKNIEENLVSENIVNDENSYDFLEENDLLYTKSYNIENEKYLQFELDFNMLDTLNNFNLIIDVNNVGDKSTFFINTIVSKYKKHTTFLILRFDNEKYYLNVNEEYLINQFFYEIDDIIKVINQKMVKINKIFVNSFKGYDEKLIEYIFNLPIYKIGLTNDFYDLNKESFTNNAKKIKNIEMDGLDLFITPNNFNLKEYSSFYKKTISIVPFPDYKYKFKKIKTNNKEIICCIIGNITDLKGKLELENIILHFNEKYSTIRFVVFGNIESKIKIESKSYNNIYEFNALLEKYNPNVIVELSNHNSNYSYTINLSKITGLPIIYLKKNNNTYVKNSLITYENAYEFENMDSLFYLINKYSQDYYYTILPVIVYHKYWNDLWIENTNSIMKNSNKFKYNIKPYFIYYPQFHEIIENNIIFYKSHNDIKDICYYNEKNIIKLNIPKDSYCKLENYDYIINESLIQKQMDTINELDFEGIAVYYYWFMINSFTNNNMIMEKVINKLFSSDINMFDKKIFFIWKNECWSNIYNCNNKVIENVYNNSSFYKNAENLIQYFKNDKYLKIENKPVFIINDTNLIDNIDIFYNIINKLCLDNDFSGIHLILNSNNNKEYPNFKNCNINFNINNIDNKLLTLKNNQYNLDYEQFINDDHNINSKKIQTIILDYNNKSNTKKNIKSQIPFVCENNTEMLKTLFIQKIVESYNKNLQTDVDKILLINSFNNWGENTSFEPSEKYGYYCINLLNKLLRE